jgi:hypothetical protein
MRTGSHRNALFTGDADREYRWFSLAANLPGFSISARRAAHQIADGIATGANQVAITPQAFLAARFANISPDLTNAAMRAMLMLLPQPVDGKPDPLRGAAVRSRELFPANTIGSSAAKRYNQTGVLASR